MSIGAAFALSSFPFYTPSALGQSSVLASFRCSTTQRVFSTRFTGARLTCHPCALLYPFSSNIPPARQKPLCYADNDDHEDGDSEDEDYDDEPDVILTEASTGRTLPVGVQCVVPHKDKYYYVCFPMDDPVAFVSADNDGKIAEPIEDQEVIDRLFPNASAVLSETHLQLLNTPFILTLADFSENVLDEDEDDVDDDNDDDDDDTNTVLGDDHAVEIVAEFASEGRNYYVVRPVEEVLLVAKMVDDVNFDVLSGNELEQISPIIEDYIERQRQEQALS